MIGPLTDLVLRAEDSPRALRAAMVRDWVEYIARSLSADVVPFRFQTGERARKYVERHAPAIARLAE